MLVVGSNKVLDFQNVVEPSVFHLPITISIQLGLLP
jgi:hypothetical protein